MDDDGCYDCGDIMGYPLFSGKPAETASENQSWSSALGPSRRTSWVRSYAGLGCGWTRGGLLCRGIWWKLGQDPAGPVGQHPRPKHWGRGRERERESEREREKEREREYSLLGDLHHHQFPFPRILKSLKSSGSELSSCPPMSPIPFHWLGSTGILLVDFNLRKIPIWGSNLVYIKPIT